MCNTSLGGYLDVDFMDFVKKISDPVFVLDIMQEHKPDVWEVNNK
jgi:hypothetical protein